MKKQTPILILASAMLVGMLAGCGTSKKGSDSASDVASSSVKGDASSSEKGGSSSSEKGQSSSSEGSHSSGSSEEADSSSSSSEEPKHVHSYNDDHICPDDGYSDPGKLAVDLDGDLGDAKWASYDKTSSLFDLKSDGRGIKVKGFTSGDYAYFGFEIIHKTDAFNSAEIIFNGTNSTDTTAYIDQSGNTRWGSNFAGAVAKTSKLASGLYSTVVEIASKLSVVAPSGNLTAAFGAVVTAEKSESSFKDEQPEYWVLKGLNPWGGTGSAFAVDADGIHHTHSYQDGKCVWCDEEVPAVQMAITPDGDASDWDETIAKKYVGTSDDEGRHFGWNAFIDDTYLYLTSTVTHVSKSVDKLALLSPTIAAVEETVAKSTSSGYSYSGTGFVKGGCKETLDEASGLTTTVFEIVFLKDAWVSSTGTANLGVLAYLPATSDASEHFDINHSEIPGYWGVTFAHNSWNAGGRFDVTSQGVEHEHSYSKEKCLLCGQSNPNFEKVYDVTIDGDVDDWDESILATKASDTDSAGPSISFVGYAKDGYVYLAMEAVHKESVYLCLTTKENNEIYFAEAYDEVIVTRGGRYVENFNYSSVSDETTGYVTTTVEAVLPLSALGSAELGYCVQAMGNETSSVLHLASNGWTGHFWVIKQLNPWAYHFTFDATGMLHEHSYSDGKCVICGADAPTLDHDPAITVDGNLSDFPEAVKNTKIANSDSTTGEGISLVGYTDDYFAYIGVEVKTTSASVTNVDLCAVKNSFYYSLPVQNGVISSSNASVSCASTRTYDEMSKIYAYIFEIAVLKTPFVYTDGVVRIGVSVNGCSSNNALTCNNDGPTYWGINNLNAWWGVEHCFIFSPSGVAAPGTAEADE